MGLGRGQRSRCGAPTNALQALLTGKLSAGLMKPATPIAEFCRSAVWARGVSDPGSGALRGQIATSREAAQRISWLHISETNFRDTPAWGFGSPLPVRAGVSYVVLTFLAGGSLPLALGFELPRGSGYGFYVVAGCDGQNRLAARCPATTRPLIERCDLDRCVRTRRRGRLLGC